MSLQLPLSGWPQQVLPTLWQIVDAIADEPAVGRFKIGRTHDPQGRFSDHKRDFLNDPPMELIPIYQTSSEKHCVEVEEALILAFQYHPQCVNRSTQASGAFARGFVQYIYVLVWKKKDGEHEGEWKK